MRKRPSICLFALASMTLATGCKESSGPGKQRPPAALRSSAAGCNLLLISMDTTRADRLGCYGWKNAQTPALDSLARTGVRFERAFTHVPITQPSHTVLLTGTYPSENGVRVNGRGSLGAELPTLAATFRQHGYKTAAFVAAAVLDSRYGLDRGFDTYDDTMIRTPTSPLPQEISADMVSDRALAWLQRVKDQPFMCWIHFFDPHTPLQAPPPFVRKVGDPYDAEIAFMDSHIGRLVGWLDTNALLSKTLIVAVADHGESLGEHNYDWHSLLVYDSMLHIPLIISLPERLPGNRVCPDIVGNVDIVPTVLDLMGWPIPPEVSGRSLVALLDGGSIPARPCYGETDYPFTGFGWGKLRSLLDGNWKYIRAPQPELYDLAADSGELTNLFDTKPGLAQDLEQKLTALEASMRQLENAEVAVDARTRRMLGSLGYVDSGVPTPSDTAHLKNPADMVGIVRDYRLAEAMIGWSKAAQAVELLEAAVQRSPESFAVVEMLGKAYASADRLEDSQRQLMQALTLWPESSDVYTELCATLARRGRFQRAVESCRKALEIDPSHERAQVIMSAASADVSKQTSAIDARRSELASAPDSIELRTSLADLLARSGQSRPAVDLLRNAPPDQRDNPRLAINLAWLLATSWDDDVRDGTEALRLARLACGQADRLVPEYLDVLAASQAEAGQFNQAVQTAQQAAKLADAADQQHLASEIRQRGNLYQAGQPYHELP